ncbi:hypothetical protein BGZ91_011500 [Linnemannia elongata]|nr:hypothetical protein BGZ91_011500 [Linnemannia elongata]KAG0054701.1 hypothetical protein BGZ90_005914 [Linnemannia elongata]
MDHIAHLFKSGPSALWSTLQDTPPSIVVPLITITAALPIVLFSLYHAYAVSPVILIHNKSPVSITTYDSKTDTTKREDLVEYIKKKCPSLFGPGAVYRPTPWLANGHLQTACSAMKEFKDLYQIGYHRELLSTPDGGTVSIDWAPSLKQLPADSTPTLVLLHGLTGGSYESYIRALVDHVTKVYGYRCVVFNARGCANTQVTSPQLFSGGYTEDIRMVVKHLRKTLPESKMMGVGFSLGSNILMNYMGEEGDRCEFLAAMSVGNPFDMLGSCLAIERGWFTRKVYAPAMGGNLKKVLLDHADAFKNTNIIDLDTVRSEVVRMRQFDDQVTRKVYGYETVSQYYRAASSANRILAIKRPFLCLNAQDDPIAVDEILPRDEVCANPYGLMATTAHGGHLGWFEGMSNPTRWCTKPLAEYCAAIFEADRRSISETRDAPSAVRHFAIKE